MKKSLLLSLALLAGTQVACAQSLGYTPPAQAAFLGSGTPTTWSPYTAASGSGALSYTPPAIGLYCQASPPSGPWTPCNPGSGGGGATFTPTGLQFATSTTAATVATASQVQTTIGTNPWAAAQTFTNGIVTNTATQGINTTSGIVNSFNGVSSIYAGTNATPTGSPVNSGTLQFLCSFGNGSSTNNHTWQIQDVLSGTSTAPNSTLTFIPAGTTGTQIVTMPALSVGATPSPVCTTATGCPPASTPLPFVLSKASTQSIQLIFPTAQPAGYTIGACPGGAYPCIAYSSVASTTSSTLTYAKNGTTFCTVTFAAAATTGTFSGCAQTAFTYTNNTTFDILTMTWSGDPSAIPAVYVTEI